MTTIRKIAALVVLLAAGFLLLGCPSGDEPEPREPAREEEQEEAPPSGLGDASPGMEKDVGKDNGDEPEEENEGGTEGQDTQSDAPPQPEAGDDPTTREGTQSADGDVEGARSQEKRTGEIPLNRADYERLQRAIDDHRGEVVLVDFWATWCPPCIESFPKVVKWHEEYGDRGLAVLTVSMDTGETAMADAREFLSRQDAAGLENYLLDVQDLTPFVQAMSDTWEGGLPAVFIYDRSGELRHQMFGDKPAEQIRSRFMPLLDEQGGSPE